MVPILRAELDTPWGLFGNQIAARLDIEVLFEDGKEELGSDQYQLMSTTAITRFWKLAMLDRTSRRALAHDAQ